MQRPLILLPLLAGLAASAMAASTFTPPEGCTTFLTVQSRGCRVSNHYICAADPKGDQWRVDSDQEGAFFISRINREGEWVESFDLGPTVRQVLDPGSADPASFSELLASGMDTFEFSLTRDNGEHTQVNGFDRLTGATMTIDGIALKQTEFEYTETDDAGNILRRARGNEFISPDWRLFFSGPSEWDGGQGFVPLDGSPVKFYQPGQPGFAATQPLFDCDAVLSSLQLPHSQRKETPSHDDL